MRFKRLRREGKRIKSVNKMIKGRVNVSPILSNERGIYN
jgi:hypothetical protein